MRDTAKLLKRKYALLQVALVDLGASLVTFVGAGILTVL